MKPPKITEENFIQHVADYVYNKYNDDIINSYDVCPYNLNLDTDEQIHKQIMTWFTYDRRNPKTGKTILDEFVEWFVDDQNLAKKILQMKDIQQDYFKILNMNRAQENVITIVSESNGKKYDVEVSTPPEMFTVGRYINAHIYPWHQDGTHRFNGIITMVAEMKDMYEMYSGLITNDMVDMMTERMLRGFQDKAESVMIRPTSRIVTILKKYPADWINQICKSLKLDTKKLKKQEKVEIISQVLTSKNILCKIVLGLSEDEKIGLRFVMDKFGVVGYSDIQRRLGKDDTRAIWDEKMPESTIGMLRRRGLLVVGLQKRGSKKYKVAAIPADVLNVLNNANVL